MAAVNDNQNAKSTKSGEPSVYDTGCGSRDESAKFGLTQMDCRSANGLPVVLMMRPADVSAERYRQPIGSWPFWIPSDGADMPRASAKGCNTLAVNAACSECWHYEHLSGGAAAIAKQWLWADNRSLPRLAKIGHWPRHDAPGRPTSTHCQNAPIQ